MQEFPISKHVFTVSFEKSPSGAGFLSTERTFSGQDV
jgi:hypothetical protein